jgi:hypothetical protein
VLIGVGEAKDLMGLRLESAIMVSDLPPLCRSSRDTSSCRALLLRSCPRPDIEWQLPAMWQLLVNYPHMGQRRVGLLLEMETDSYAYGRAGPTRGLGVQTREVREGRWRPTKAPARPADRH